MRERFAQAGEDSAEWKVLEGTFRRAFDALEVVRVVDGVPIIFWKPFKLVGYPYEGTSVLEKVVIEVYLRSASIEGLLIVHLVGLNRSATSFCAYDANALVAGRWGSYAKLLDRSFLGSPLHFLCLSSDPNGDSLRLLLQGRVTAVSSTVTDTPALFSMGG